MSPGSRRTSGAVTRAHMSKQQKAALQELPPIRTRTRSPPLPLLAADNSAPAPNPHCIAGPLSSPSVSTIPPPPDTPPPLVDAFRPSAPPESASDRSSARSSPEASWSPYVSSNTALHPSTRVSLSPEATYATSRSHLSTFNHSPTDTGYGYNDPDQAPSPASSAGSQPPPQSHPAHPVSPQSSYAYGGSYGIHHGNTNPIPNGTQMHASRPPGKLFCCSFNSCPLLNLTSLQSDVHPVTATIVRWNCYVHDFHCDVRSSASRTVYSIRPVLQR